MCYHMRNFGISLTQSLLLLSVSQHRGRNSFLQGVTVIDIRPLPLLLFPSSETITLGKNCDFRYNSFTPNL